MTYTCKITFVLWKTDEPLEIQLEPEAITFQINPGNNLTFVGYSALNDFEWTVRVDHKSKGIQLFPEGKGQYRVEIFENERLLEDWYKYM